MGAPCVRIRGVCEFFERNEQRHLCTSASDRYRARGDMCSALHDSGLVVGRPLAALSELAAQFETGAPSHVVDGPGLLLPLYQSHRECQLSIWDHN